eukprot:TRINITY_DN24349_c1_g1_i2.p1 TRINITY_DN24349_c1_g1~~TRINITY_DN24349_c1_g1_i2.p1  ORF type:complete len:197 (+),score=17.51 TRINITY_DN24349_c1_g1_i2:295-885(+)
MVTACTPDSRLTRHSRHHAHLALCTQQLWWKGEKISTSRQISRDLFPHSHRLPFTSHTQWGRGREDEGFKGHAFTKTCHYTQGEMTALLICSCTPISIVKINQVLQIPADIQCSCTPISIVKINQVLQTQADIQCSCTPISIVKINQVLQTQADIQCSCTPISIVKINQVLQTQADIQPRRGLTGLSLQPKHSYLP